MGYYLVKIIKNLKEPGKTLSQRIIKSSFWLFMLRIIDQGFSLIRLFIIARILDPYDFGLISITMLILSTLETFTQSGFQQALIQKKENIKTHLDTAWTFLIIRSFIVFLILYLIAPYAAAFFKASEAKIIIQVVGISVILQAFTNIGIIYYQKEIEFNKQFIVQLSSTLADFTIAVIATIILRNVWALVLGTLAGNVARLIVSYIIHPYRPHFNFDIARAKELFTFGRWVFGSSIFGFLTIQGDNILVGNMLGIVALGIYQMAYRISNMPTTEISKVISTVMFPAYSKLQNDLLKLKENYLKILQITAFVSMFITGIIFSLSHDFIVIFLGNKWLPVIPVLQVLVFAGFIRSIAVLTGNVFLGIGKPENDTKLQIVRLCTIIILIYPLTLYFKILGTAITVLLSILISNVVFTFLMMQIIKCHIKEFCKSILPPIIIGFIMIIIIHLVRVNLCIDRVIELILLFILGLIIFVFFSLVANKLMNLKMDSLIKNIINDLKGTS